MGVGGGILLFDPPTFRDGVTCIRAVEEELVLGEETADVMDAQLGKGRG